MSGEKFLLTIKDNNMFGTLIRGLALTGEEAETLSQCKIARVNVIPSEKYLEIFLEVNESLNKKLLEKIAWHIKNKYNNEGDVTISPRYYSPDINLFSSDNPGSGSDNKYKSVSTRNRGLNKSNKHLSLIRNISSISDKLSTLQNNIKANRPKLINPVKNYGEKVIKLNPPSDIKTDLDTNNIKPNNVSSESVNKPNTKSINDSTNDLINDSANNPTKSTAKSESTKKQNTVSPINGQIVKISDVNAVGQKLIIEGYISANEDGIKLKELSSGKMIISFNIVDDSNGIGCVKFYNAEEREMAVDLEKQLSESSKIRVRGTTYENKYTSEISLRVDKVEFLEEDSQANRKDDANEKRVELHCHTRMSQMDAVMSAGEVVNQAAKWGWNAVAITDHGVVQAYPEAIGAVSKLKKKGINIKVIYGMEGYLVGDDYQQNYANHIILLAKNHVGLKNLYTLISLSHLRFFYRTPRIPKSILSKYRRGLIIGSACEAGELIRAIVAGASETELEEIAGFYDYLEIQPIHNNDFLKRSNEFPDVNTDDDLISINLKVAELAKKLNKPLVATCDAHFMNPEDSIYRAMLMKSKGFKDAAIQPPLYLRTTNEMLAEFTYLDEKTAYEAVVTNPNKIAAQIEELRPIPEKLYSPQLDGAEEELKSQAYKRAKELYGEELPEIVKNRMEQELKPIIGHGFAALYMIAERLVKKSNSDGYIVGSRGSVGSSFIATMLGITEVNPLPPHWYCPNCQHSEFITDGTVNCGYDLDDKNCPNCGIKMNKDGHDIPFAVFLGFDGDKVPDIDLNFSGEYQSQAHKYTEILFGKYNVYRAGTISTVADKTAYGIVKSYYEELGENKNGAYISYMSQKCQGVKRTTGQHPAGIMVVPRDMDVHYFTPLQHPADDKDSKTITTHFDYHSISERLVKLDILGHDDPTVLKMLEDITHVNVKEIPLDDKETLSLFTSTEALKVDANELGTKTGTFGIPEFRTAFTRQMIEATKPNCFSDLVRISGFSHGTDVWLGNAQELIKNNTCTLKNAISARDDIMTYLIYKGVDPLLSFKTMEGVRKGRGISDEVVAELQKHDVPDWYIESCQKIKYLFPKAHATAYVMMAFRIAYFKVHYPLAYYAASFTSRGEEFNADEVTKGDEYVKQIIKTLSDKSSLDVKETAKLALLQLVHEMYLRGFGFRRVNIYNSDASKFIIEGDKLIPPLSTLEGLGQVAAGNIVQTRQAGQFISIEDLKNRAKLSKTNIEVLRNHGCLYGMDESSQQALF